MFTTAKKVARPKAEKPAKGTPKEVVFVEGLEELAALDACMKALAGLIELKKDALKEAATERLLQQGVRQRGRPDSLSMAAGEYATGNAAIFKRSTRSPLTADELAILAEIVGRAERDEEGAIVAIPGFVETTEVQPAMLAVNPDYAADEVLLKRIDKALKGVKGIPEDFILSIPAETKTVVTEGATNAVFALNPKQVPVVFGMIANVVIKPVFASLDHAWDVVRPMLDGPIPVAKPRRSSRAA